MSVRLVLVPPEALGAVGRLHREVGRPDQDVGSIQNLTITQSLYPYPHFFNKSIQSVERTLYFSEKKFFFVDLLLEIHDNCLIYRLTSKTWPLVSGTLLKVTYLVDACTETSLFTRYQKITTKLRLVTLYIKTIKINEQFLIWQYLRNGLYKVGVLNQLCRPLSDQMNAENLISSDSAVSVLSFRSILL